MWNKLNKSMMVCQMAFGLSFYGVMAILTRFFLEDLKYNEADTMMAVGAFSAIGPLFAIAGGFIADRFLGSVRSLTIAYGVFASGYFLLVIGASATNVTTSLLGIALASYARGLMSPSYPTIFKRTFQSKTDFENGFTVNYSVNNVGALLGQYLFPLLVLATGFHSGFLLSGALAILAFVILVVLHKPLIVEGAAIDKNPVAVKDWFIFAVVSFLLIGLVFFMFSNMDVGKNIVYLISAAAIAYFIRLMFQASRTEVFNMGAMLIMVALTIAFFIYYGQMMTSMTIVSINTMRGDLFGFIPIAPEAAMAMNPFWCMVAGPVIAGVFSFLEKRGILLATSFKVAIAFVLTAIAFAILTFAVKNIGTDIVIRPEVFLVIHFFQAFAEVIVGSMVVAFILSVAPKRIEAFSVSLNSVAIALSGVLGAVISTAISVEKGQTITQEIVQKTYGDYFFTLTVWAVVMVGVAMVSAFVIRKMLAAGAVSPGLGVQ